jgi:UDP-glucose 4-epimerase
VHLGLSSLDLMRILITGGLGFIGGRVATHLSSFGHQIVIASRTKHDPPLWLPTAEMFHLNWDVESSLRKACEDVDVVIHTAGMNSSDCEISPEKAHEFNGSATQRLVEASVAAKVKTFVYLSTAHVYEHPLSGSITETITPKNQHPYATSHIAGEKAVLSASIGGEIDGIVLRLSNVYGAPTHKNVNCWMLLVNDLCKQAVTTQRIILRSSGTQQRNFLTMSDACAVIASAIFDNIEVGIPKILNVGSRESETVFEMAIAIQKRCQKMLGIFPQIETLPSGQKLDFPRLSYDSLYTLSLQNIIKNNRDREIDLLLNFCSDSFGLKTNKS